MKVFKKIFAIALCGILIASAFAGCSKSGEADKITDKTMLIAYTDEVEPFLYKGKNGKLAGFDIDLFKKIYDNVKNDTKNYEFVKVDKDYKVGDDVAYTNKDGDEFIAYTMIGAVQKNVDSVNEDFSFTNDIITNRIITVTKSGNNISDYNDLSGKKLAVVTDIAKAALDKNSTIKNNNKNTLYPTIEDALSALDNGSVDAVITDEFNFSPLENAEKYQVLNGELDRMRLCSKKAIGLLKIGTKQFMNLKVRITTTRTNLPLWLKNISATTPQALTIYRQRLNKSKIKITADLFERFGGYFIL